MAQSLQGILVNYRIGPRSQKSNECIIQFVNANSVSEASRLIGRKVAWKSGKNRIVGKVVALHGKKGLVRARFRKSIPSRALGSPVELVG